jgi:hypothetical protein
VERNDVALWVGGLAFGGWLLYALTREDEAEAKTTNTTPTGPKPPDKTPSTAKKPAPIPPALAGKIPPCSTDKLPTGSYWHPYTRAKIGEVDQRILNYTKGWVWPVETEPQDPWRKPVVGDGYRFRSGPYFRSERHPKGRWHNGGDISFKRNHLLPKSARIPTQQTKWYDMWSGVRAIASGPGHVVRAGFIDTGGRVLIDHGNNIFTAYLHLERIDVKKGDEVRAGHIIGLVGKGKKRGFRHLHFEIWYGFLHKVLDPSPYLKQWSYVGRKAT